MYVCDGFCRFDVPPSPKFQACIAAPVLLLVKFTINEGWQAALFMAEKAAVGFGKTVINTDIESEQAPK